MLKDKVIIVTGGAGLIGKAFIADIARVGGIGIIADVNIEKGKLIQEQLINEVKTGAVEFVEVDITSKSSVQSLVTYLGDKYGRIDALVNNAYPRNINYGRKFEEVTYEDFCENVNLHLGGYFLITQQVAEVMMKQNHGNIINMASIYGFRAPRFDIYEGSDMTTPVEYAAIKGAIINLTRYLASYLGRFNIRANCISPGGVFDTQPGSFVEKYSQQVLLNRRMADVNDLTGALIFLLSDASNYMTGQNIVVDGGWSV